MFWPPIVTRSIRSATRYKGGRTRLGRRRVADKGWPYLVFLILFVLAVVSVVIGFWG